MRMVGVTRVWLFPPAALQLHSETRSRSQWWCDRTERRRPVLLRYLSISLSLSQKDPGRYGYMLRLTGKHFPWCLFTNVFRLSVCSEDSHFQPSNCSSSGSGASHPASQGTRPHHRHHGERHAAGVRDPGGHNQRAAGGEKPLPNACVMYKPCLVVRYNRIS